MLIVSRLAVLFLLAAVASAYATDFTKLFQSVDPVKGFRPDQAFHQFYLNHMTEIGVPIGPLRQTRCLRIESSTASGMGFPVASASAAPAGFMGRRATR